MNSAQNIKITVNITIFAYHKNKGVNVLLTQRKTAPFKGGWALPGGLILEDESPEDAVKRDLEESTGLYLDYTEQLHTFGAPDRDPRGQIITVAYLGLLKTSKFEQSQLSFNDAEAKWFKLDSLPPLAFDHNQILQMAIHRLQAKVTYQPIGLNLLDEHFTFSELETLYTSLLNRAIDRRNFKKKIMSLQVLTQLDEKVKSEGRGRPGHLYKIDKTRYRALLKNGFHMDV